MTREEAIKQFESELKWAELNTYPYVSKQKIEADKMAIKALEQKPCEDAVSREAVEDAVIWNDEKREMLDEIQKLPSVPKQKTGHWIELTKLSCAEYSCYVCSECEAYAREHSRRLRVQNRKSLFCPDCGLKMVEPQESEDK